MSDQSLGRSIDGVTHHHAHVNGTTLHYVRAGESGTPILLVHGFPESWWAFHKVIPLLAREHRVYAVDLRGFGDSAIAEKDHSSSVAAQDLHELIRHLDVGPVVVAGQDIAGGALYRLAHMHAEDVSALVAVEMGLAGFGLEGFADVTQGGSWHIGALAAPGIPQLLFTGREEELLATWAFPSMTAVAGSITATDIGEFARGYARPGGWNGAAGIYCSILTEGEELRALTSQRKLTIPVLAVGGFGGGFTAMTMGSIVAHDVTSTILENVGHYVALEAPDRLSDAITAFLATA
ncbi:alpha/beta hydrolase [Microbacterium enclense]|uniref:Alpha/beta hydrolase n=1 Tax=Microbacterium enclense TaxID=993073 RepID=A0A443J764_9MICO|nr:alpha/beta hydrolase [Microbacterium enclense]RWR16239.1 alpha/beta hydrolase [Microbacterium enclense]